MATGLAARKKLSSKDRSDLGVKRKRFLNIVYFVDSEKTNSIKMSVKAARAVLFFLALLGLWSILSAFFIYKQTNRLISYGEKLKEAKGVIFEYESRYDGIFEKSYPNKDLSDHPSESVASHVEEPSVPQKEAMDAQEGEFAEALGMTSDHDESFDPSQGEVPNSVSLDVLIESPKLEFFEDKLTLKFGIRNVKSPQKIEGKIWAKLSFKDQKQRMLYFSYPPNLSVDDEGNALNPLEYGSNFSIRNYKEEEFSFSLKEKKLASLEEVSIYLLNKESRKASFHIDVSSEISNLSSLNLEKSYAPQGAKF